MAPLIPTTALLGRCRERYALPANILRVTTNQAVDEPARHALLNPKYSVGGFGATLGTREPNRKALLHFTLPEELHHLSEGDIIRLNPERGEIWVMYRRQSPHNSLLLTERCNSYCVMCSQPPRKVDDSHLIEDWKTAIPLMSPETGELGFTGGEPLLLGKHFFDLLRICKHNLPETAIHILSNGRLFNYLVNAKELASIDLIDLMIGIPLYSDIAWRHDFVVQSPKAFDQTIRGIINLARLKVRIEIRVVVHKHTIDRLPELAKFITRNLPFVSHVAIMGLEPIGFGKTNLNALWLDPAKCHEELYASTMTLSQAGVPTSLYNYQLCVLPQDLWPFAVQSISDWKNIYLPPCDACVARNYCAGFFHSARDAHSDHVAPILELPTCLLDTKET